MCQLRKDRSLTAHDLYELEAAHDRSDAYCIPAVTTVFLYDVVYWYTAVGTAHIARLAGQCISGLIGHFGINDRLANAMVHCIYQGLIGHC